MTRHLIKERKNANYKSFNDFIQLLLIEQKNLEERHEREEELESPHFDEGVEELKLKKSLLTGVSKRFITEEEILAQAWIFFVAGYETNASTLAFVFYELALNEYIQQRLYEEVLTAVDANGDIDYDFLSKLQYLDAVIAEALRLHCVPLALQRTASGDCELGTTGIKLYKGQRILVPIYALHHLDEFFEEPQRFNPERFMPENRHKIKSYSYLPFGGGPRNCVGIRFALMEAKVCLAQLILRFRILRSYETDIPLKSILNPNFHSVERVFIAIERRI